MAAQKKDIELLPKEEWEKTPLGKLLNWTLTVGRYIVMFTELIVILAFLSRFKLDRELTDLYEAIKSKQAVVESASGFENDFRFLQKRLTTINNLGGEQLAAGKIITEIASLTPLDVFLKDFSFSNQKITLTAVAHSEKGLATFIRNLQNSPHFGKIFLSGISLGTGEETGIQFKIEGEYHEF